MYAHIGPDEVATGVVAVLAGKPPNEIAANLGLAPDELAEALDVYQTAGTAALHAQAAARGWYQVRVQFSDWAGAEHIAATRLGPNLQRLHDVGVVAKWWFIRKAPCWRVRCQPGPTLTVTDVRGAVASVLDELTAAGTIEGWRASIYEPESLAFGGSAGIRVAHGLFHADSTAILDHLRRPHPGAATVSAIGRRELSILLCIGLLRAAGQDWHEQGDVWHRVTAMRPLTADIPTHRVSEIIPGLHELLFADTDPGGPLLSGPLAAEATWMRAFIDAGRQLGTAARNGTLERGLRDILAHHVIFHWNRLGLPARTQAVLAHAARDTVMRPEATRSQPGRGSDVART